MAKLILKKDLPKGAEKLKEFDVYVWGEAVYMVEGSIVKSKKTK